MDKKNKSPARLRILIFSFAILFVITSGATYGSDLSKIKERGALRHLGVPYANFVTGSGDGLDVELVQLFARHLEVEYKYVKTDWQNVIGDLSGKMVKPKGEDIAIIGDCLVKGDIIANGLTILPWRKKIVIYSTPTFPTQVWLITCATSPIKPIKPSGDTNKDIDAVKALLRRHSVLGIADTCLDPSLYGLEEAGATISLFHGNLNELAPAIINREAEATLLDVPDALIALGKWPGRIKVIGPISQMQEMGYAFANTSPLLRDSFNRFFNECKKDGTYMRLVKKYYPAILRYYLEFFEQR